MVGHSGEQQAALASGVELAYETFGDSKDECVLLIAGHGYQMIGWKEEGIVQQLVTAGCVIQRLL